MNQIKKDAELSAQKTGIEFSKIPYNAGIELPIVLTPTEVSKRTGYSRATIQRAMDIGLLRTIRLTGKERSIRLDDLRAWLNGETQPDRKDINADHSRSAKEIMESMGLLKALGITNPNPEQERSIEHD